MATQKIKNQIEARERLLKGLHGFKALEDICGHYGNDPFTTETLGSSIIEHLMDILEAIVYELCECMADPEGTEEFPQFKDLPKKGDLLDMPPEACAGAKVANGAKREALKNGLDPLTLAKLLFGAELFLKWACEKLEEYGNPALKAAGELLDSAREWGRRIRETRSDKSELDTRLSFRVYKEGMFDDMTDEEIDEYYRPKKTNSRKSLVPLFIKEILEKYTDEKNRFRTEDIRKKLEEEYEIIIERKALEKHINTLVDEYDCILAEMSKGGRTNGVWYSEDAYIE